MIQIVCHHSCHASDQERFVVEKAGGAGTLSVIFTNRLKPSDDFSRRRPEMLWQKSFAFVLDSTSNT